MAIPSESQRNFVINNPDKPPKSRSYEKPSEARHRALKEFEARQERKRIQEESRKVWEE